MPEPTCAVPGCDEHPVAFPHFPTVIGYCLTHGNVLANFLSLIDAPGLVGFDRTRAIWERVMLREGVHPRSRPSSL